MNDQQTISELRKQVARLQSEQNELRLRNVALLSQLCETNGALLLAEQRIAAMAERSKRLAAQPDGALAWVPQFPKVEPVKVPGRSGGFSFGDPEEGP